MLLRAAASSPALFRSAGSPMMAGMPPTTASEAGTTSGLIHCSRRPMLLCCRLPAALSSTRSRSSRVATIAAAFTTSAAGTAVRQ